MSRNDEYSDEFLTNAVKQDAHASALKYSALGLQAFLPKRPTGAAPKPNTRFLRNILRETDSHNAALLAKEKREARERERALARTAPGRLSPVYDDERSAPRDQDSHGRRKRRREVGSRSRSRSPRRGKGREKDERQDKEGRSRGRQRSYSADRLRESDDSHERARLREKRSHKRSKDERSRDDRKERHRRRRSRDRSGSRSRTKHGKRKDEKQMRRQSSRSSESRTPAPSGAVPIQNDPDRGQKRSYAPPTNSESPSDSDPLDAIIGPSPPPPEPELKSKGRGAFGRSSAAMDAHFSSTYDPTTDVQPDPESEDDWEQALEAIRDRQKWRKQGADRLRSAGFSEAEVKKWEKGDTKDETDVAWAKKGEDREWDRGKVLGDETVELRPSWS